MMRRSRHGFSLIELLLSMAVLSIMLVILGQVITNSTNAWSLGRGKITRYQEARQAFETIQQRLSQATLATYWDYEYDPSAPTIPTAYAPRSSLIFRCGEAPSVLTGLAGGDLTGHAIVFTAALGRDTSPEHGRFRALLNLCGFYVSHGPDESVPVKGKQAGLKDVKRFRLFEFCQPANELPLFATTSTPTSPWTGPVGVDHARPLAENIILLVLAPVNNGVQANPNDIAPGYSYDAAAYNHELPAELRIIMVAMDEASAIRIGEGPAEKNLLPTGLFKNAASPADIDRDLRTLQDHLNTGLGVQVAYQIFDTVIPLPASRWNS